MPGQVEPISVPVAPGMREDLSEHLAPVGTLKRAINVRFPQSGEAQARPGNAPLSAATSADVTPAALNVAENLDYLRECPGGFCFGLQGFGYRYDFGQGRVHTSGSYGNALPAGKLVSMAREELQPTSGTSVPWPLSQAYAAGYVAVMYSAGNGQGSQGPAADAWFCQIHTVGGTLAGSVHSFNIGTASAGWVVADGSNPNSFVLLKQNGTDIEAAVVTLAATGISVGAFSVVAGLSGATDYWGACEWPGLGWCLTYQQAGTTVHVRQFTGTTGGTTASYTNTGTAPISIYCDATHAYAGYVDVNFAPGDCVARARVYNTSMALTSGVGAVEICRDVGTASLTLTPPLFGTCSTAASAFVIVGRSLGAGIYGARTRAGTLSATGTLLTSASNGDVYGVLPVSAPFNNGMFWARTDFGNGITTVRNVLLDYQLDRVTWSDLKHPKVALVTEQFVNLISSGYGGGLYRHQLCPAVQMGAGSWVCGLPRIVRLETHLSTSQGLAIAEWVKFDLEAPRVAQLVGDDVLVPGDLVFARHPWGTILAGAASIAANQKNGADVGFYVAPSGSASASNTGPGALNTSSTYQYRVVIERIDTDGNRYRSAPSPAFSMTTGAADDTGTVTGLFPASIMRTYTRETSLANPPTASKNVMHVYRTEAGATSAGATFHRCTPPQGAEVPVNGSATYVDQLSDANLITREILYTDGGVLNNDHPPSCRYVALSEDRLWLAGLFDDNQAQSSKILVPGEAPAFTDSPAFRVVLPEAITGIACQDGAVVFFAANAIYALQGAGPTDQGQGAWDTPRVITRSTGCINSRAILVTSSGIFFQSARGIELLPRGLGEPVFIGAGVQDWLYTEPLEGLVLSAAVITSRQTRTARFCIGGPYVLVFDLDSAAWSVDMYPRNVSRICDTEEGAVVSWEDIASDGYGFFLEGPTYTVDALNGTDFEEIPCELRWAAIHPFSIAGWGTFKTAVGMFDEQSTGYRGSCTAYVTVDNASDAGATFDMTAMASPDYREHLPASVMGTAVKLRLTTTAGGWRFMGWSLGAEARGGTRRMSEGERG